MSNLAYNYNGEDLPSFEYNDDAWQAGASSSSSDIYSPPQDRSDAMERWASSCHNIIPFDYEAWQVENPFAESDNYSRGLPQTLSVWDASSQSVGNRIPRSALPVPEDRKAESKQTSDTFETRLSPSCPSTADSPADSTIKSPYSRKHLSASALNRRRSQNRESQRSFRERQKLHVQWLEDQVRNLKVKYKELENEYIHLDGKYQALLEKRGIKEEMYLGIGGMSMWSPAGEFDPTMENSYQSS